MNEPRPDTPLRGARRILIVRLDNVGDVVMTGPAVRALKQALPDAHVTVWASPAGARAARLLPWVDDVIETRVLWQDLGALPFDPRREHDLVERLARADFDVALIFTSFSQSPHPPAYVCYLAGIGVRVGASKEFAGGVLSHAVEAGPDERHQVDRNADLLEAVGVPVPDRRLEVRVGPGAEARLRRVLRARGHDLDEPWLVLGPWASCPARTYPPLRAAEAAARLARQTGLRVALTGVERDRAQARELVEGLGPEAVDLVGELDLAAFAALVAHARLVLCPNTGTLHLADAFAVPVVVPFSGTDLESQWAPRRAPARLLRQPTPCRPCYAFTCPIGLPCLDLDPDTLVTAGLELLEADTRTEVAHAAPA
jgi:ADP-heptose:LPS heptosyltransferase